MSIPFQLTDEAQADYDDAYRWYESRQTPSGQQFEDAIELALVRISANPFRHPKVLGEVRKALVPGYRQYVIYYTIEPAVVTIHAVFHTSRDPAVWQSRVPPP